VVIKHGGGVRAGADETCSVAGGTLPPHDLVENRSGVSCRVRLRPMVRIMPPPAFWDRYRTASLIMGQPPSRSLC
jgi:hypothetical protein